MVASSTARKLMIQPEIHYAELPLDETKWCSVSLAEVLKSGKRLEASVFEVHGKHAREAIKNCKWESSWLYGERGIATAYTCGRFKRVWLKSSDLPIYQPSSITELKPTPDGFLSNKTKTNIDALRVHKGQILLTCSGTVGKVALVTKTLDGKIFSHDLIRLNAKEPNDIGFIYTFLRSEIGNTILQTNNYGAVIQHIEPEHLSDIPIPNPPWAIKTRINDLIKRSFALRDDSNDLIDRATTMLITALHLPPIDKLRNEQFNDNNEVNNYSVELSNFSGRLDASFHIPLVKSIINYMKTYAADVTTVGDRRVSKNIILPGRFKRIYVEDGQGRVFFGGKQINELDPSNKKYLSTSMHSARIEKELEITENTVLITRSGTVGKVAITPKHWEHWVASDHIIRVVPNNNNIAGYLYIFLSSIYGYHLITRFTYGSVVDEIDDFHVSQIPFPLLKDERVQNEINHLALDANELRNQAYKLEQEAIRIMNDEVIFA